MPLWESVLCPKGPLDKKFKLDCLLGKSGKCDIHKLKICPQEVYGNGQIMHWMCFQKVVARQTKQWDKKKVTSLESFCIKSFDFLAYLIAEMKSFIVHNFIQHWQESKFKQCLSSFPHDAVLLVIDFSDNYTLQNQNKIQETNWHNFHISILVHIIYCHNPEFDLALDPEDKAILKEYHYYLSDEKSYDTHFVQHFFELHQNHMSFGGSI